MLAGATCTRGGSSNTRASTSSVCVCTYSPNSTEQTCRDVLFCCVQGVFVDAAPDCAAFPRYNLLHSGERMAVQCNGMVGDTAAAGGGAAWPTLVVL